MSFDLNPSNDKGDAPTNPLFTDTTIGNNERIFTAIAADGASTFTTEVFTGNTQYSNLATTKGFRIKCYDALTTEGIKFNPAAFSTHYYFVLIHSDIDTQHHFARITEYKNEDEEGDAFEFEPKLGNEIPKDTKFMIFKGHLKSNDGIVAFSAGILNDTSSLTLEDKLSCARPLFYFFNDLLDKNNELDHNTKYYAMQKSANILTTSHSFDTTDAITFRTVQDFGKVIIDYSKFSHRVTLTDKLRDLDNTITEGSSISINEGGTITADNSDYNEMFPNARRISDDEINSPVYTGPKRYLHYDYSPTKSNLVYQIYNHTNTESIDGKGGFAETFIIDNGRIMPRKIKEFDAYRVRQNIHRGEINEFFPLATTYSSKTSNAVFSFNTEYDLSTVLNAGDEVKLGDNILIVQSFGSLSGATQEITFQSSTHPYVRTENEGVFTAQSTTPSSGEVLHRRAYNATDGTLMLDISLLNGRFSKMYVAFTSLNHNERFATITACDATKGMITLSFNDDSYNSNPLSFTKGQYRVFIERFNGEVENIENKKENGQTIMQIQGRDKFNKLLSPIVNLNTLFSEDIIYSSNSPYNKLSQIDSTTLSIALGDTTKATGIAVSDFDIVPTTGDRIFTENGYIGQITSTSGDPLTINFTAALTEANSEKIYIETEKNYVLLKALGASHLATNKPTSLTGAANKGLIFTAGNKIDMATGAETDSLVSSSINTNQNAIGYPIHKPKSISKDLAFQSLLKDEYGSAGLSSFDTVNTLIDFEIINVSKKENNTIIELAPYIPITLGSYVESNNNLSEDILVNPYKDLSDITDIGTNSLLSKGRLRLTTSSAYDLEIGDELYSKENGSFTNVFYYTFLGKVIKKEVQTDSGGIVVDIYLDSSRSADTFTTISKITRKTHEIGLINGSHLWGGKILISPHPQVSSSGTVPLNVENTTGTKDYNAKFGQMYYKPLSLTIGNFTPYKPYYSYSGSSIPKWYDLNKGKINYLLNTYKLKPNISSNNITNYDTTDSNHRVLPIHKRGNTSVYGSNVFSRFHKDVYKNFVMTEDAPIPSERENYFSDFDSSAIRKFLFITGDLLPYSSLRKDSLLHQTSSAITKNIHNYNMMLIENKNIKDTKTDKGTIQQLKDLNFQNISFSTEEDISTLKKFSIMRLTEICFDSNFNPINPEKPILPQQPTSGISPINSYQITDIGSITLSGTSLTCSSSLSNGDKIYDTEGNFIGEILSGTSPNYTLTANAKLTDNGSAATSGLKIEKDSQDHDIYGKNLRDTSWNVTQQAFHPLKVAVVPEDSAYGTGTNDSIYIQNTNSDVQVSNQEIYLPTSLRAGSNNSRTLMQLSENVDFKVFYGLSNDGGAHKGLIGVALDRFSIEEGGKFLLNEGNTTQVFSGNAADIVDVGSPSTDELTHLILTAPNDYGFKNYASANTSTASNPSVATDSIKAADGAYMVFKPRLWIESGNRTESSITSSNGNLFKNEIKIRTTTVAPHSYSNVWLDYVDLTGCYLASENGKDISGASCDSGTETLRKYSNGLEPTTLTYVISHEVDENDSNIHHLITDKSLPDDIAFRILQPNEMCFYNFMPLNIKFNLLLPEYTKMANKNETYNIQNGYFYQQGVSRERDSTTKDEGVLSMFVILDTDRQTTETDLVIRDGSGFINEYFTEGEHSLYFSDGKNGNKLNVEIKNVTGLPSEMIFEGLFDAKGVVSVSETFTVSSNETIKIEPTRACIGSTVSVGLEGEDLINELLEQEGIQFETSTNDIPIYLAPNYQGVDLYSAIRYVLDRKNMKLIEENNVFKIIPENESSLKTNITIDDSGDFLISEFEKISTLFDFFNEINVYGNAHKAIRKDLRSIQKRGRKTLEIVDNTLLTQEEVDKRAINLLQIHSRLNKKLSFTMQNKGINQLRVGDIVNVYIPRENIEMNEYIVLEMEHSLTGFIKLQLGRYNKDLSDIFSELLVSSKQTKSALRSNNLTSNEISYNFLDTVDTKELKLLVRKREATGSGRTLGFGTALGFTTPLGFTGGEITITDLVEEDLA